MWRFGTRGEGRAGCVFWLLLFLIIGITAFKVIPVKMTSLELKDFMKELAMNQPRKSEEWFEKQIRDRAHEVFLEIPREQIKVSKRRERIIMDVQYTVPIEVLGFTYEWDIEIHLDRDLFFF